MNKYTEAIQGDDVVILCDGIPMGVGEILAALNAATPLPADAALADAVALLRRTYQNHWPSTEIKAFLAKIDAMPDAALRALSQPEVAEVPEGFVLVPIEPTEAMIIAGDGWSITKRGELRTVYRAMLSAARLPREVRDERQHSSWRQGANRCLCSR